MKKKIFSIIGVAAFAVTVALNINASLSNNAEMDVSLSTIENQAQGESGSSHGRPLMQSGSGAYKCAKCSGSDCGAAC